MAMFHVVFTIPVNTNDNGTSESPLLTEDDLWAGCLRLAYYPADFTSFIAGCTIHRDTGTHLVRTLFFHDGPHSPPGGKIEQEITLVNKLKVSVSMNDTTGDVSPWQYRKINSQIIKIECTTIDSGNKVITSISRHPSTGEMYLSFTYEIPYGDVEEGSEEAKVIREKYTSSAGGHLTSGVKTMRELKQRGLFD